MEMETYLMLPIVLMRKLLQVQVCLLDNPRLFFLLVSFLCTSDDWLDRCSSC